MLCHDVDDVFKHLKREHIEVRGTFIAVSDSLSKCIEILIDDNGNLKITKKDRLKITATL